MLNLPERPARSLAVVRIVVGLVGSAKAVELGASPSLGTRPEPLYPFLPTLPGAVWPVLGVVMLAAAALTVVGFRARAAALALGLSALAFIWGAGYYSNHTYLLATLAVMLSFTDCDAALSVRSRRGAGREQVWGPPVYLLRAQISIVYGYAAVSKLNIDFLSGNGLASWGIHSALVPHSLLVMPVLVPMAVGAVATELFVATGLWVPRLRPFALTFGVVLHLGMILFLSAGPLEAVDLALFASMMIGGYVLFLDRLPRALRPRDPADPCARGDQRGGRRQAQGSTPRPA